MSLTRRTFVQSAVAASAGLGLGLGTRRKVLGANDQLRVGIVGIRGRGNSLLNIFHSHEETRVVALCDVDQEILDRRHAEYSDQVDHEVARYGDFRHMLERQDIDIVVLGTCNHWHALQTIWACQAGKDVYVEKPLSHTIFEGRQAYHAAKKYQRIVAHGTQSRTSPGMKEMVDYVQSGKLGPIQYVIGTCYRDRPSIGKLDEPLEIADSVNYDLWCGPAQKVDLYRPRMHYDWHWDYNTGDGDIGNQGVHQLDLGRWFMGEDKPAQRVLSIGGRVGVDDAANTANTQIALLDYDQAPFIFEVRGFTEQLDDVKGGARVGVMIRCENGYMVVPSYSSGRAYDNDGEVIESFSGGDNFISAFLKAVRSRDESLVEADAWDGHVSSTLGHQANISHLLGTEASPGELRDEISGKPEFSDSFERMVKHLKANDVDINDERLKLGAALEFDQETERFIDNDRANEMVHGMVAPPREGYEIPTIDPS